jgi:hypothetical protein
VEHSPQGEARTEIRRSQGISLHIGLNYKGQPLPELKAAEDSAGAMQSIADRLGYKSQLLPAERASKAAVTSAIGAAAAQLGEGDIFFLTFAGHGAWKQSELEADGFAEGWQLFIDPAAAEEETIRFALFDHELYDLLTEFREGVRIVIVSDSCMSGGMLGRDGRKMSYHHRPEDFKKTPMFAGMPPRGSVKGPARASIILIASCPEGKAADDGSLYMLFTTHLLRVWDDNRFQGNYTSFTNAIRDSMANAGEEVLPELKIDGTPNHAFLAQRPFTI